MASINRLRRELLFKLVFYGPGMGGKTTTLRHVHAATKPENRGNIVSLATDTDRTLYFDYLPVQLLKLGDMTVKLLLYTVPGQVYYAATRKLVLSGADGVVFVADSQAARLDSNHESLDDLNHSLAEQGRKLSGIAHAFQWNKRDLPDVVPLDELDRRFNLFGAPSVATVATTGEGVFEILERVTRLVIENYQAEIPTPGGSGPLLLDAEDMGLADAIRGLADSQPAKSTSSARRPLAPPPTISVPAARTTSSQGAARAASSQAASALTVAPAVPANAPPSSAPAPSARSVAPAPSARSVSFSFAELWPAADRDAVRRMEHALSSGDAGAAVTACDDLLSRVLTACSVLLGGQSHTRDPASLVTFLGLDGVRYMALRAVARAVRANRPAKLGDAFDFYLFALEARRKLDRANREP
ncbi:MAG TPA: GTPase domain-containing protein [Polyangiaceae bacterium]|jgi:signal recognition particle receptor subunit beta|nr:GTPase domain-containing protein [Polyangiaceae bacterium]